MITEDHAKEISNRCCGRHPPLDPETLEISKDSLQFSDILLFSHLRCFVCVTMG